MKKPRGVETRVSRSPAMLTIRCVTPGKIGATSYHMDGLEIGILPLVLGPQTGLHASHPLSLPALAGAWVDQGKRTSHII